MKIVDNSEIRMQNREATEYYNAARSSSNDVGPRRTRINIIKGVLLGAIELERV